MDGATSTSDDVPSGPITPEYPDQDQLGAYGALCFLYSRAPKYDLFAFRDMRRLIQPPIDLRFYHIHRIEYVPRAAITWGYLAPEVEANLAHGRGFTPSDWASGQQAWIMEVIAPYREGKLGAALTKAFLNSLKPEHTSARFPRYSAPGKLKHVTEFRRQPSGKWTSHRIAAPGFKQHLKEKGYD